LSPSPLVRWLAALTLVVSLAACDSSDLTGPTPGADGAVTVEGVTYSNVSPTTPPYGPYGAANTRRPGDEFGCTGGIWNPKKGRYDEISIKVNLPKNVVEAANGKTYEPRFALNDPADENRLLMSVVCTLPNVQGPEAEKAHTTVGRFLAKEVRKLQRDLDNLSAQANEAGARVGVTNAANAPSAATASARTQNGESCSVQLVAEFYFEGIHVRVYDLVCSSGGGGTGGDSDCDPFTESCDNNGGGTGSGGDPGGGYPDYCGSQFMQTPECEGSGGDGTTFELDAAEIAWREGHNPRERELCLSDLIQCGKAYASYRNAEVYEGLLIGRYPGMDVDSSPMNARKHSYWSASLTIKLGPAAAEEWTNAHELPHIEGSSDTPDNSAMDFYNNKVGRRVGGQTSSVNDLYNNIEYEFGSGRLRSYPCGQFPGNKDIKTGNGGFCPAGQTGYGNPNFVDSDFPQLSLYL
jgi:hypothetical protein